MGLLAGNYLTKDSGCCDLKASLFSVELMSTKKMGGETNYVLETKMLINTAGVRL